jgi:hypothetical protein
MAGILEFFEARVSHLEWVAGEVRVRFARAHLHRPAGQAGGGAGWSQEAVLVLHDARLHGAQPRLPNTVVGGWLEIGGVRHEALALPFHRKVPAVLSLEFADGGQLVIHGRRPLVELLGEPMAADDLPPSRGRD